MSRCRHLFHWRFLDIPLVCLINELLIVVHFKWRAVSRAVTRMYMTQIFESEVLMEVEH